MILKNVIFTRDGLFSLITANLVVIIPFIIWMTVSPLLPPDRLMSVPRVISFGLFIDSLFFTLVVAMIGNLMVGIPALYYLEKKDQLHSAGINYLSKITKLVSLWCAIPFALIMILSKSFLYGLISAGISFIALAVPSYLAGLVFWYFYTHGNEKKAAILIIAVLFFVWNIMGANFAALVAAD